VLKLLKLLLLLGVAAAAGIVWYLALPPRAGALPPQPPGLSPPVRGAIHVHSNRSDGTARVGDIAAAAARAGLQFVVFTDHGDALRKPDPPRYLSGVLCIDAVEISTQEGHVVALGLPESPYPLGGEARDVLEDVARLGGFAIAAHPGSEKPELRWDAWESPMSGLEWLNADSEWRNEPVWSLARAVLTYPVRATETLATLLDRPSATLERWDNLTRTRRVVALAGSDAHARIGLRSLGEPYDNGTSLHLPSYEQIFRVFSNSLTQTMLSGDAAADSAAVIAAIRAGHVYSTIDALGGPAAMSFTATSGKATASGGDVLPLSGPVAFRVEVQAPADARIGLWKDGNLVETRTGPLVEIAEAAAPGVYRVEVSLPGAPGRPPIPWIVSNPIYAGRDAAEPAPATRPRATTFAVLYRDGPPQGWIVENSQGSLGAIDLLKSFAGTHVALRYGLGGAASSSPFTAFVLPAGPELPKYSQLTFSGWANKPTRVSVQLREPSGSAGERWHRSVYLAPEPREVTVYFADMTPRGATSRPQPDLEDIQAVLFVVDTVNTPLGGNGTIWIDDVRYGR
jgi:hypothetical protein